MALAGALSGVGEVAGGAVIKQWGAQRDGDDATEGQAYVELSAEQAASLEESGKNIRDAGRQEHQNIIEERTMIVDKMTNLVVLVNGLHEVFRVDGGIK